MNLNSKFNQATRSSKSFAGWGRAPYLQCRL